MTRRTVAALLLGFIAAALAALVLWVLLFLQFTVVAPPCHPTFEAARPEAISTGGRHRWPGTVVRDRVVSPTRIDVERRWLGLRESTVHVDLTRGGWCIQSPQFGPALLLKEFVAVVVPSVCAGALVAVAVRRRARQRVESKADRC